MVFNSSLFIEFFLVVYGLYLLLRKSFPMQNALLLVASYFFYGSWNQQFLVLLIAFTVFIYGFGLLLGRVENERFRTLSLLGGMGLILSLLFNFKYAAQIDYWISSLTMQPPPNPYTIRIFPIGLSFYTFLGLSYLFDDNMASIVVNNFTIMSTSCILPLENIPVALSLKQRKVC